MLIPTRRERNRSSEPAESHGLARAQPTCPGGQSRSPAQVHGTAEFDFAAVPELRLIHGDYGREAARFFAENLKRYVAGEPLANVVDKKKGY